MRYEKNRNIIISAIVVLLCVAAVWLYADSHRNDRIHNDTDSTMADVQDRVDRIESRVDSLSDRIGKAEKAVDGISVAVERSRENAVTIKEGIGGIEKRLDSAIQRSGRLENLINDIETANSQRTQGP